MAKGFSESEKKIIKDKLINAAEICWSKYGIKKTTVDELAKMADISKGAFYLFYQTKELLFLDVLERTDKRTRTVMLGLLKTSKDSRKQKFINSIREMFLELKKSPWIFNLQNGDYEFLVRKLPEETVKKHVINDENEFSEMLKYFNVEYDHGFISAALKALFFMHLHENEIGEKYFDETMMLFIETIANLVMKEE